jgi:phage tail sheath protein FI
MPPCGAVAGLFADRALNRGAWIAPANQAMRGVIALAPALNPSRRLDLQEAHINLVRQEPHGFLVLDAETLSDDPDLVQMNVRRLLILLRRQALVLGAKYVFEPNSPAFRRSVDRGFTEMLDGMFERGAFAGATPASAYQVVTDASLNTPQSVEQGRFIVELRVAPSLPMTFMTIRLVQTSERSLAMEVR